MLDLEKKIDDVSSSINNIKLDVNRVSFLIDRFDTAIIKLTELSASISQLLAVHGNRIDTQEQKSKMFGEIIEERRKDVDSTVNNIYTKINSVEKELEEEMSKSEKNIIETINEVKSSMNTRHDIQDGKIEKIQKLIWTIMGGGAVISFLINAIDLSKLF